MTTHKFPLFTKFHWAFGRSLDKTQWVLTGVLKQESPEIRAWLESHGAKIRSVGCHAKTRRYWFGFVAPKDFVLEMAKSFPIPNGARALLIGFDGSVRSKSDRRAA